MKKIIRIKSYKHFHKLVNEFIIKDAHSENELKIMSYNTKL